MVAVAIAIATTITITKTITTTNTITTTIAITAVERSFAFFVVDGAHAHSQFATNRIAVTVLGCSSNCTHTTGIGCSESGVAVFDKFTTRATAHLSLFDASARTNHCDCDCDAFLGAGARNSGNQPQQIAHRYSDTR